MFVFKQTALHSLKNTDKFICPRFGRLGVHVSMTSQGPLFVWDTNVMDMQ